MRTNPMPKAKERWSDCRTRPKAPLFYIGAERQGEIDERRLKCGPTLALGPHALDHGNRSADAVLGAHALADLRRAPAHVRVAQRCRDPRGKRVGGQFAMRRRFGGYASSAKRARPGELVDNERRDDRRLSGPRRRDGWAIVPATSFCEYADLKRKSPASGMLIVS